MSSKKKLITAISSLSAVVVVAAIAIAITFAALSATVTSSFTISYHALSVNASVAASYTVKNGSKTDLTPKAGTGSQVNEDGKTLTFQESADSATGTFDKVEVGLTATNDEVVFAYVFTNLDTTDTLQVTLNTGSLTYENLDIYYGTTEDPSATTLDPVTITESEDTKTIYVKFKIKDKNKDVSFSGSIDWTLENIIGGAGA